MVSGFSSSSRYVSLVDERSLLPSCPFRPSPFDIRSYLSVNRAVPPKCTPGTEQELTHRYLTVGRPIIVKQNQNPSNEELHLYQKQYIDELMR